jgi:hypothetical protein
MSFGCVFAFRSPKEVKDAVISLFGKCNWDVLRRKPTPGSHPPDGKTLCDLIFELGIYFCRRTGQARPVICVLGLAG